MNATMPIAALQDEAMPRLDEVQMVLSELLGDVSVDELVTPIGMKLGGGETLSLEEGRENWLQRARRNKWQNPTFCYNQELAERIAGRRMQLDRLYGTLESTYRSAHSDAEKLRARLLLNRTSSALGATYLASGILHGDDSVARGGSLMRYSRFMQTRGMGWKDLTEWARIGVEDLQGGIMMRSAQALTRQQIEQLRKLTMDARSIAKWFRWAIGLYGFDYDVVIDTLATGIGVRETSSVGRPVMVIPASRKMHGLKLVTLVRHEIDCHVRDAYNGRKLLWGLGGGALRADDGVVSEGHAITEEYAMLRYIGGESPRQAKPWYVLALAEAIRGNSFSHVARDIYALQRKSGEQEDAALKGAWITTYRVFRGISNTRNPDGYAFWKDKAYLQGCLEIGDLYDAGLQHWAEIGAFELDELVMIAQVCQLQCEDVPHPDINAAQQVLEKLLS